MFSYSELKSRYNNPTLNLRRHKTTTSVQCWRNSKKSSQNAQKKTFQKFTSNALAYRTKTFPRSSQNATTYRAKNREERKRRMVWRFIREGERRAPDLMCHPLQPVTSFRNWNLVSSLWRLKRLSHRRRRRRCPCSLTIMMQIRYLRVNPLKQISAKLHQIWHRLTEFYLE